jgi:hypothetical protein
MCRPPDDPDLATVIEVWPELPEEIKAGILAMVNAFKPECQSGNDA